VTQRLITAEILDSMDPGDPRAIRSRRDLRIVNAFLGNSRWIVSQLHRHGTQSCDGIVELGAGEGFLCRRMREAFPRTLVTGLDFAARPAGLPENIQWEQGDFRDALARIQQTTGQVCVGSLILHHFSTGELDTLTPLLSRFSCLVFCEPFRGNLPLLLSKLVSPFAGEVTRHDMPASIRAGFRIGELPLLLGLDATSWRIHESVSLRGSLRLLALRR
jgi:hypothetical protein